MHPAHRIKPGRAEPDAVNGCWVQWSGSCWWSDQWNQCSRSVYGELGQERLPSELGRLTSHCQIQRQSLRRCLLCRGRCRYSVVCVDSGRLQLSRCARGEICKLILWKTVMLVLINHTDKMEDGLVNFITLDLSLLWWVVTMGCKAKVWSWFRLGKQWFWLHNFG